MANYFVADGAPTTGTGNIVLAVQGQFTIDLSTPSGINVGDVVKVTYKRNGVEKTVSLTLIAAKK